MLLVALLMVAGVAPPALAKEVQRNLACANPAEINYVNPPSLLDPSDFGFSQVVTAANSRTTVWIAGQTASDRNNTVIGTTLDEQVDVAVANVKKALEAVGATVDNLVHVQYFIAQYNPDADFPAVLKAGRSFESSGGSSPAAEVIGVQSLGLREYRIEISAVAALP